MIAPHWLLPTLLATPLAALPATRTGQARPRVATLVLSGENTDRDWRFSSTHLRQVLEDSGKFDVEVALYPDGALVDRGYLERFELVVVDYFGAPWGDAAEQRFVQAVHGGTGVLVLGHSGAAFPTWDEYGQMLARPAAATAGAARETDFHAFDIEASEDEHPITEGLGPIRMHFDRIAAGFWPAEDAALTVLATAKSGLAEGGTGEREPVLLAGSFDAGHVVHLPLGNVEPGDERSWSSQRDPQFQQLLLRSAEWAATGEVTANSRMEPNTLTDADRAAGWRLLFDGSSTSGWEILGDGLPEERWQVDGGVLRILPGEPGDGDIVFEEFFDRFELEFEWRVAEGGDPGVLYQLDEHDGAQLGFDADVADALRVLRPPGEFNHARVVATEYQVEHWLNGIHLMTFDMSSGQWAAMVRGQALRQALADRAPIARLPLARLALRGGGGDVWMRNLKIRRLPEDQPQGASSAPRALTNGGAPQEGAGRWTWVPSVPGTASPFTVSSEGMACLAGAVGYLRTNAAHAEYVVDFDYRLTDPSAQASILLHVTGPDRIWPRSIEVQLIRHYAGDLRTWGNVPTRETLRQVNDIVRRTHGNENGPGEWNHLELRHAGGTLTVHLNGEIVNALTEVEQGSGFLAIKTAGGALEIRNPRLTPID